MTLKIDKKENDFFHFLKLLPDKGTVLDIGANIGITTTHLSFSQPKAKIYSFEPVPVNFKTLSKIVGKYKLQNVTCFNFALGEKTGNAEMVVPEEKSVKLPGLSHVLHESISTFNEGSRYKTEIKRLDDLQEIIRPVTGIKLDAENFEFFILSGAKTILKEDKPLIYTELWENQNRDNALQLLKELGYKIYVVSEKTLELFNPQKHRKQNFIAIAE